MSGERARVKACLIAGFDDAAAIEARPIGEVRADLAKLGIDPARSIALAKRLARVGVDDPATRLLGKIEQAETIDAEIAAFETAAIEDVRAALPSDVTESATVAAEGRLDSPSNVAGLCRRRSSVLGWRGSLIGIAACLLLFIAVRPDQAELGTDESGAFDVPAERAEKQGLVLADQPPVEPSLSEPAEADDVGAETLQAQPAPLPSPMQSGALAKIERRAAAATRNDAAEAAIPVAPTQTAPARPILGPDDEEAVVTAREAPASDVASAQSIKTPAGVPSSAVGLPSSAGNVTGVLIVGDGAPAALRLLERTMFDDRLSARIDKARDLASGRTVLALLRMIRDGREVEAALVENVASSPSVPSFNAFAENDPAPPAIPVISFELIELTDGH